ncbi:enoyl-CoA hydratase/isomerase family protein [Pseudochelatococcus sp. B33]
MSHVTTQICDEIKLFRKAEYAILQIDREAKRNAMNRSARMGMLKALDQVREDCPVVVLTGAGKAFCSGIDLKERSADVERGAATGSQEWADVNVAIRQHPAIFIAAVNGIALGGGVTLINVCDLALAAEDVEIGMPEQMYSTYPGLAGPATQLSLSRKRAAWMVLTAERISAQTALEWGLVNGCMPAAELLPTAEALAGKIATFNPIALSASKQALDRIPATITDWRQAFAYGGLTNAGIRLRIGTNNPYTGFLDAGSSTKGPE